MSRLRYHYVIVVLTSYIEDVEISAIGVDPISI